MNLFSLKIGQDPEKLSEDASVDNDSSPFTFENSVFTQLAPIYGVQIPKISDEVAPLPCKVAFEGELSREDIVFGHFVKML